MKTINKFFGLAVLAISMFSFTASASALVGETNSDLGKYWLKEAVNVIEVSGEALETYVIHYDHLAYPVYVGVLESKKGNTYIVRTDGFEIAYVNKKGKFGVEYMPKKLATLDEEVVMSKIDREHFLNQRVITPNNPNDDKALKLIAAYLPQVMK
ncbi:hypothetical protein ACE01N_04120 [Saccharicrinis sp. FJH2]|uniref:hypothetical protein n=1 Tax=unclassified Saccharicrinis TaxID=2646859 RepID=UPI0035D47851